MEIYKIRIFDKTTKKQIENISYIPKYNQFIDNRLNTGLNKTLELFLKDVVYLFQLYSEDRDIIHHNFFNNGIIIKIYKKRS